MPQLTPRDLLRTDVFTRVIQTQLPAEDAIYDIGDLAPIRQTNERSVRLGVREADLTELGQFRSLNGPTPLITSRWKGPSESQLPLAILAEKDLILEDVYMNLRSPDTRIAQEALRTVLNSAVNLAKRNVNLSRWMVWQALQDNLTVQHLTVPYKVDYKLNNSDSGMSRSHFIDPSEVLVKWNDPTAEVIENVEAWTAIITQDDGTPQTGVHIWMSTKAFKYIQKNIGIQEMYGDIEEPRMPRTPQAMADVLGIAAIHLYDSTYRDRSQVSTRYFPENRIFLVVPSTAGERNVELLDGPVARWADGDIVIGNNPGMIAEYWASPDPLQRNIRISTSRMPFINRLAVVVADVY